MNFESSKQNHFLIWILNSTAFWLMMTCFGQEKFLCCFDYLVILFCCVKNSNVVCFRELNQNTMTHYNQTQAIIKLLICSNYFVLDSCCGNVMNVILGGKR